MAQPTADGRCVTIHGTMIRPLLSRFWWFHVGLLVVGCSVRPGPPTTIPSGSCTLSASDQMWVERSLSAWQWALPNIVGVERAPEAEAILFDRDCVLASRTVLTTSSNPGWNAVRHDGMIVLPDGDSMPTAPTSFMKVDGDRSWFVMSTPSVWRAGGVPGGPLGLETLMVAVWLHEAIHLLQFPTYGMRMSALIQRCGLPDSFNDDSIQERFGSEEAFASSVEREMELLFSAADAHDDETARALAGRARTLMRARHDRWLVGEDACLREAEDLWLTLEGSGQWVGYEWLVHDDGAGATPEMAMTGFGRRSRWWSQNLGLALVRALDRLDDGGWRQQGFADGEFTVLELLDAALERGMRPEAPTPGRTDP
jgi:hypothetical protein